MQRSRTVVTCMTCNATFTLDDIPVVAAAERDLFLSIHRGCGGAFLVQCHEEGDCLHREN